LPPSPKDKAEMVSEILKIDSMLAWLTTQEDLIAFSHYKIFNAFAVTVGCSFLDIY
jgi:hypothetical protein